MKKIKTAEEILEGITPYSIQGYPLLYDAVDVRNAMRIVYEQFKPEWIPFAEFKPEHKKSYFVALNFVGFNSVVGLSRYVENVGWISHAYGLVTDKITHVQELPELPSLPNPKQTTK